MTRISYLNGKFLPHDQCLVHIEDRGFQFADGAYEVTLFKNNKLIDGTNHMQRMLRSLKELNIMHKFTVEFLLKTQLELLQKNQQINDAICYMQITRGTHNRIPNHPKNIDPTIAITIALRNIISEEEYNNGLKIMTHDDIRWHRCDIKTVNLVASAMVNQKAKDNGFDDAIYIRDGFITEATYANVFIVDSSNNLITHPSANEILSGITRSRIISLAIANKINVIEKKFTLEEMFASNEAFLTGSVALIRVINSINNIKINNNREISALLRKLYDEFINQ